MVRFDFMAPQKILFGEGRLAQLGDLAAGLGRRVYLVTGSKSLEASGRLAAIGGQFEKAGLKWEQGRVEGEPTVGAVDAMAQAAKRFGAEAIVAVGGGSVLDTGKAVAALLGNGGEVMDYLEGAGRGKALDKLSLPCIAIPTTAGTGSEATKNAVITTDDRTEKRSMRADTMLPAIALVDPELTYDCPLSVTAACGMDALTQLIESFTSRRASPLTDSMAREGLMHGMDLLSLVVNPKDAAARGAMALASLLGGTCLANAGLGAVHALASPLGALFPIPHGVACARLLPAVLGANSRRMDIDEDPFLSIKYSMLIDMLTDAQDNPELDVELLDMDELDELDRSGEDPAQLGDALTKGFSRMNQRLEIPGLGSLGVGRADFDRIIDGAGAGSLKTNPVELTREDLRQVLEESL